MKKNHEETAKNTVLSKPSSKESEEIKGTFIAILFETLRMGAPLGLLYCVEVALLAVVAFMMGKFGTVTLAAYQIAYQYWMLALLLLFALAQATTVRVGYEVGKNNKVALNRTVFVNMLISIVFMLIFCGVYFFFPKEMISVDLNINAVKNQAAIQQAMLFLSIICALLAVDSVRLIGFGALRGIKDTRFSMVISVIGFWGVSFPCAYLAAFKFHFGAVGIWWSMVLGLSVATIITWIRFYRLISRVDLIKLVARQVDR